MTKLNIEDMSCNHCVKRIGELLTELSIKHTISLDEKSVTIDGSQEEVNKAIAELDEIGYTATIA